MANRFMDGFDYYPTADLGLKYTSFTNVSIVSSPTRFSSGQSLSMQGGSQHVTRVIDSQGTWTIGCAMKFSSFATAGPIIALSNLSNNNTIGFLNVSTSGILSCVAVNSSLANVTMCTGTHALVVGVWYYIEFQFQAAANINLINTACHIAGLTECSFSSTSGGAATSGSTADTITIEGPTAAGTYNVDDVYINDGTGSHNTSFLGDIRVEVVRPASAGASTTWTPDSGSNFARVNETTEDGDTSYVATSTANNIDAYNMGALLTTPSNIFAVQANVVARKTDAGAKTFQILTRISSTNYFSSTYSVQDSYNLFSQIQEVSPATSVAFTASEVNSMQMGVKLIS